MTRPAGEILALVRAAYAFTSRDPLVYPMARAELHGGDAVGTDAYPALRDARGELLEALRSTAADVRIAAAYGLAFIVEHAAEIQPALDEARAAAAFPLERAAMILAAARLRTSASQWRTEPAYAWDPVPLDTEAAAEPDRAVKAALAFAQVIAMAPWGRKIGADVADALSAVAGIEVGPWGDGDLGLLTDALLDTAYVDRGTSGESISFDGRADSAPLPDEASATSIADQPVADPYTQERPVRAAAPRIDLPGLRDVPWSTLEHAYGPATGIPDMIVALASPDGGDRAWAQQGLAASINHQGSVYSASAPAVPFLLALVERQEIEDRGWILELLAGLAVGDPRWRLFADLDERVSPAFAAVSAGAPSFVRLLADSDPDVRGAAAYALSFVAPCEGAAVAVKRALAVETDRYARSSLVLALGYVGRRTQSTADRAAIERYLDDDCMLIAGSAAIALAQIDRGACSPRVRAVLARTISDAPPAKGDWPWVGGNIASFARTVRLAILSVDDLLDEADAAKARGDLTSAHSYAVRAFGRMFFDGVHGVTRLWVPDELDDRQRRVLRFLVTIAHRAEGIATGLPMDSIEVHAGGLVTNAVAAQRLVGDAKGPLDRALDHGGRRVPAWFAIDEVVGQRASRESVRAAFGAITPAERLEMIEDAMSGPFALSHSRAPMDFADPGSYDRANDYASEFIMVMAALLGDCALAGLGAAREMAEEQANADRPRAMRCLVAAIVLAAEARASGVEAPGVIDRLVLTDQAPVATYRKAIRATLELLPPDRQRQILGAPSLYAYQAHVDPRGQVRRWVNGRGWDLVDLLAPAECIAAIGAAWREWQRHRAAGDDPTAEPVSGTTTSSIERAPGADEEFPFDKAREILARHGEVAASLRAELDAHELRGA